MSLNSLSHFPFPTIRDGQKQALTTIDTHINDVEIFVIRSPVASGKSGIAIACQSALLAAGKSCAIVTPNNILRDQYTSEFDHLTTIKAQSDYLVPEATIWHGRRKLPHSDMSVKEFRRQYGVWPRGNQYTKDLNAAKRKGTACVVNTYGYLAHKLYKDVIIFDEAHELLDMLREIHSKKIWQKKVKYPDGLRTFGELIDWTTRNLDKPNIQLLHDELIKEHPASVIEYTEDLYFGAMEPCIKVKPLHIKDKSPIMWPDKVKRLVLMSATISPKDIEYLGLSDRVVKYIDTPSPIPVERRRILPLNTCSLASRHQDDNLELVVAEIKRIADEHAGQNGLVHAPYSLARKLRQELIEDDRFIFHTQLDKTDKLEEFKRSKGKILIGSGLYAGIDLKYDLARFQIITKIPFGNLADSRNRWLSKNDSDYYAWETAKNVLQASGRTTRAADDTSVTYVIDNCWSQWYNQCEKLIPLWFREAVKEIK
jgi:Rad3-related DNA helicase